jgi:hypothetical protein
LKASSEFRDLFLGLIEELASARPLDASALARRVETYAKQGTASSLHRERAAQVVSELAEFFRDVLRRNVRAATHEDPEQNTRALPGLSDPIADAAEGLAQELRPEALFSLVERCLDATVQIDRKAHLGLILETLFAGFAGCLVAKRPVA